MMNGRMCIIALVRRGCVRMSRRLCKSVCEQNEIIGRYLDLDVSLVSGGNLRSFGVN